MTRVVLGSASPGRRKVLRQAGIEPLVVVSDVDENSVAASLKEGASPAEITTALAIAKASEVAQRLESSVAADCVVIGCDSMLYCAGELRGKPSSTGQAQQQWRTMAGKTGDLYTGHCVIRLQDNAVVYQAAECMVTAVLFATPSEDELAAYVESGEPMLVAGGFTLDGLGGWFVNGVDGDPSSVIGISLPLTRRLLEHCGLSISQLWAANPVAQ